MDKIIKITIQKGFTVCLFLLIGFSAIGASRSPEIVAHRAGTADAPENTYLAIDTALKNHADAIWISIQSTKDAKFVLYRPSDLNALTDMSGQISSYTANELKKANAAIKFNNKNKTKYTLPITAIPELQETLRRYPATQFYIDLKSPDTNATFQAKQLFNVLNKTNAFSRTRFYSTNSNYINALTTLSDKIQVFENRDKTRTILANSIMEHLCELPKAQITASNAGKKRWYGFELRRKVEVVEHYTLGEARSPATLIWDKSAIECFRKNDDAYIMLFGINTLEDYQLAKQLGADAVMVDSPKLFYTLNK